MSEQATFTATLYDSASEQQFANVLAFQSRDDSGGFSIWPGQVDFIALANSGISTLRQQSQTLFIAAPQLLIEFTKGQLTLSGRKIFIHSQLEAIRRQLQTWMQAEQAERQTRSQQIKEFENQLVQNLIRLEGQ